MVGNRHTQGQLGRYVVVGLIGYAVQVGSFALLTYALGVRYVVAAAVAGALALVNNFLWNRHWTFGAAAGDVGGQAWRYTVISLVFFAAQIGVLHLLVLAGTFKILAQALSVIAVVPSNFLIQRRLAFNA